MGSLPESEDLNGDEGFMRVMEDFGTLDSLSLYGAAAATNSQAEDQASMHGVGSIAHWP